MKKIKKTKQLAVSIETIRKLDNELVEVRGGYGAGSLNNGQELTCGCPTGGCHTQS